MVIIPLSLSVEIFVYRLFQGFLCRSEIGVELNGGSLEVTASAELFHDELHVHASVRTGGDMDDLAEIGRANHFWYEKQQEENRTKRDMIPDGECKFFDEAYERLIKLQELDLASINVNMFKAYNNQLINDGCGLFRGRQILPFEHLSRFQNDNEVAKL